MSKTLHQAKIDAQAALNHRCALEIELQSLKARMRHVRSEYKMAKEVDLDASIEYSRLSIEDTKRSTGFYS